MTGLESVRRQRTPLRFRFREIDVQAADKADDLPLLSVSVHDGVVPRLDGDGQAPSDDLAHYKRCWPGDVVLNKLRAFQGGLGVTETEGIVSPAYAVLRFDSSCHPRYVHYLMRSHWFVGQMTARLRGLGTPGTLQVRTPHINVSDVGQIAAPLPSLETQRRIANVLDSETDRIDALLRTNRELARLLRERYERVVLAAVSEGVSDSLRRVDAKTVEVEWLDRSNGAFPVAPYAMLARTGSGHTPSRSLPEYWVECDVPWVTTSDVKLLRPGFVEYLDHTAEKISQLGMANSAARLHPAGTVFLSRTASVGFSGIMAVPMATSQDFFTWTPDHRLRSEYLLWSLRAMRYAGHFDRLMYGSTHKTIYVPDLMVLRGPIPPIEEQDRIVAAIREQRDETVALLDRLDRANQLLAERRQALISAAVTGKLEV